MMISSPHKDSPAVLALGLADVIEQSLLPENQQIRPANSPSPGRDYRKMLDTLGQIQTAREIQAAFSPY